MSDPVNAALDVALGGERPNPMAQKLIHTMATTLGIPEEQHSSIYSIVTVLSLDRSKAEVQVHRALTDEETGQLITRMSHYDFTPKFEEDFDLVSEEETEDDADETD